MRLVKSTLANIELTIHAPFLTRILKRIIWKSGLPSLGRRARRSATRYSMVERGGGKCLIKIFGGRSLSDSCRDLKDVLIALEQSHDTLELIAMACSVQQCGKRGIRLFINLHSRHHTDDTAHGGAIRDRLQIRR